MPRMKNTARPFAFDIESPPDDCEPEVLRHYLFRLLQALRARDGSWRKCPQRGCHRSRDCTQPNGICEIPRPPVVLSGDEGPKAAQRFLNMLMKARARLIAEGKLQPDPEEEAAAQPWWKQRKSAPR